ncbi:MAG TPA: ATP-grasp domain-containing protein [Terriglobales bacterium]|nr:ATP-grasp domain-containing protein [Terriglobales bacterium]
MREKQRVLLFAAKLGYQTRSFEEVAQKLGVDLAYATDRCHELKDPWGDGAVAVHFEAPEAAAHTVIEKFRAARVDGIIAVGDRPTIAAAYAARGLGIAYNHPASAEACRSKLRLREIFREAGLRTPRFQSVPVNPPAEPALLGISFPCVLKPTSLSASQGVIRANSREEFAAAAERIRKMLAAPEIRAKKEEDLSRLIVEEYIPGREVAVEGLLIEGRLHVLSIFDKPDALEGPYFEETIYVTPSRLSGDVQREIVRCASAAVGALGLTRGPVHAEFRINEEGVWPLEVAPRPIGGMCASALRFVPEGYGETIGLEELLLRHALGEAEKVPPRETAASAVMMIPVPRSGILEGVEGEQDARNSEGITDLQITARVKDLITAWPEGSSYLGFLFAKSDTPEEAEAAVRAAHGKLRFAITPQLPVEHPVTGRFHKAGS